MSLRIYGNRLLKTLPGLDTRPTSARVREALFNIWQADKIQGKSWLDICTGSGSMGAEALCRGASLVVGIEESSRACALISQNWQQVASQDQTFQILRGDALKKLPKLAGQQFDCIYCDPPYAAKLYRPILEIIAKHQILHPDGEIAIEHSPQGWDALHIPSLEICREKVYGSTALTFYQLAPNNEE